MASLTVLSLGGSIIVPHDIDMDFLAKFKKLIKEFVDQGERFAIICGGGSTARRYQQAASKLGKVENEELDWIGIHATTLNAHLIRALFGSLAEKEVIVDPTKAVKITKPIVVASGWKPGWSTDYDAVMIAKACKSTKVINMSNIDYVYDKDPKQFGNAKKISEMSWRDYRAISGSQWEAGLSLPFDPIASKEAEKAKLQVHVIGKDLPNLKKLLTKKQFEGTTIS